MPRLDQFLSKLPIRVRLAVYEHVAGQRCGVYAIGQSLAYSVDGIVPTRVDIPSHPGS